MKPYLAIGPLLFLIGCGVALADPGGSPVTPGSIPVEDILRLSPIGALVWGAFVLGRNGFKVSISVSVDDKALGLFERLTLAVEKIGAALQKPQMSTPSTE